MMLPT
jgi:ABC-type multidrug transport system ATPase subunit